MLVLRTPWEDPLSSSKRVKRRVQAFVLVAIAVFVAGGAAARSFWASERQTPAPATTPARDIAVLPSPQGQAGPLSPTAHPPMATRRTPGPHTAARRAPARAARPRATARLAAAAAVPVKVLAAEDAAVRFTNAQRAQHGCTALRVDPLLRAAARAHSADMHRRRYFAHDSPDGRTPGDRNKAAGYAVPRAENIAAGYATARAVVQGWMNSPGHRANILDCSLKAVGIGVEYGQGGPWWTEDFGYR